MTTTIPQGLERLVEELRSLERRIPPQRIQAAVWWLRAQPEDYARCWAKLAIHGWFPHPSFLMAANVLAAALDSDPEVAEQTLVEAFRSSLSPIETELIHLYPHRKELLRDGFAAHRNGIYSLSILMFISQADGIANEQISKGIFDGRGRKAIEEAREFPEEDVILPSVARLLHESLPMWLNESERRQGFRGLNRHLVMHGKSTDYNTEKNSLQAVSFLSWLAVVLNHKPSC